MTLKFWREPALPACRVNWSQSDFRRGHRKAWRLWLAVTFFLPRHPHRWLRILQEEIVGAGLTWADLSSPDFASEWMNSRLVEHAVPGTKDRLPVPTGAPTARERYDLPMLNSLGKEGPVDGQTVPKVEAAVRRGVPRDFAIRALFPFFEPGTEKDPYRRSDHFAHKRWRLKDGVFVEQDDAVESARDQSRP